MTPPAKAETSISEFRSIRISYGAFVWVVGLAVASTFAFAVWMTTINIKIDEQGDAIEALKSVDKRLTRIETVLEDLKKQTSTKEK